MHQRLCWLACYFAAMASASIAAPPRPANLSGYTLAFADEFDALTSIAEDPASNPTAKWFRKRFFGDPTTLPSMMSIDRGVLTLVGTSSQPAHIQTAAPFADDAGWKGRAFRNGAYFEARIALGDERLATASGWPAFWSMAIEHMPQRGAAQWPGQKPGYMRFVENDFFEFNPVWSRTVYYATLWEWYGEWERCQRARWCDQSNVDDPKRPIALPDGKRWSDFNVYGQKWVPARDRSDGYVQNYLNGRPVGVRVTWRAGEAKPPAAAHLKFNMIDRQGLVIILGTGGQPMRVDWVRVWQPPAGRVEQR
jgi:hypothetical protein